MAHFRDLPNPDDKIRDVNIFSSRKKERRREEIVQSRKRVKNKKTAKSFD
jgi:hypothetical protein